MEKPAKVILIEFMEWKSRRLGYHPRTKNRYFMPADRQAMFDWPDEVCEKVLDELIRDVKDDISCVLDKTYLSGSNCPFCLVYLDHWSRNNGNSLLGTGRCADCPYGRLHGICSSGGDWCYFQEWWEEYPGISPSKLLAPLLDGEG